MAYIYQIQNDVNEKIYIGKTEFSIEKRFKEHCKDAFRESKEHRPLYAAIRKYGEEHFHISLIEETDNPEEREKYWIEKLQSFKNGYNATIGGDGRAYIDYDLVCSLYKKEQNQVTVANIMNISVDSVKHILTERKIPTLNASQSIILRNSKNVGLLNDNKEIIQIFSNSLEAAQYLKEKYKLSSSLKTIAGHVRAVCQNKRKTAYKHQWCFI